jgi:hypothetical protein
LLGVLGQPAKDKQRAQPSLSEEAPQHIHYPPPLTHRGAIALSGSAHLTCLLNFRDGYLRQERDSDGEARQCIPDICAPTY